MTNLTEDSRLCRAIQSVWSQLGEDVVILDLSTSSYLSLEDIGATVWGMLDEPRRLGDLEAELAELYEVERAVLRQDLRRFVQDLVDRGLLVHADEDTHPIP